MGTVNVVFAGVGGTERTQPAYNGAPLAAENVTSSGTSAQSAAAPIACATRIHAVDAAVYVKTGANPTAAAGDDWYVASGGTLDLFVNAGDKVAVINA